MAGLTWFKFMNVMHGLADRMPNSECPVVFVLSDGRVVEPKSASVELVQSTDSFDCTVKVRLEEKQ